MTADKVTDAAATGVRHQFLPGPVRFDPITFIVPVGSDTSDLDTWMSNVAQGVPDARDGRLDLLDATLHAAISLDVFGLSPVSFSPFATSLTDGPRGAILARTMVLGIGRVHIE
jgi:hypothetical protein